MPAVRYLLFDLDGTLVDSAPGICPSYRAACLALGYGEPADDLIRPLIGLPLLHMVRAVVPTALDDEAIAAFVRCYRTEFERTALPATTCFPGVVAELTRWRAEGRGLAVATSKHQHVTRAVLRRAGIEPLFDAVVGGDDVPNGKPAPDTALHALALLGAPAAEAALVGDTTLDIAMARAAGVPAYAISHGVHDRPTLEAARPVAIVDQFEELAAYLG